MSAFIISTETMQRVVDAIDKRHRGAFCGMPTPDSKCLDTIGEALFALNAAAVNDRYSSHPEQITPPFRYRSLGAVPETDHFMALSCLLYQLSEGNIPETEMYKALDELCTAIAVEIAHKAARKAKAPWDWSER